MDRVTQYLEDKTNSKVEIESIDVLYGAGISLLLFFDDAVVQLSIRDEEHALYVLNIHSRKPDDRSLDSVGTGRGKAVLEKLRRYVEIERKRLFVVGVTDVGEGFWRTVEWLKNVAVEIDLEGRLYIDDRAFAYTPSGVLAIQHHYHSSIEALPIRIFFNPSSSDEQKGLGENLI